MTELEKEKLHAYVDGELDARENARIVFELQTNPEAADYVRSLYDLNEQLSGAFDPKGDDKLLAQMVETIRSTPADSENTPDNVVSFERKKRTVSGPFRLLAASVAGLAIGIGSTLQYVSMTEAEFTETQQAFETEFTSNIGELRNSVLESQLSGQSAVWSSTKSGYSAELTPIRTMVDGGQQYCREYRQVETYGTQSKTLYGIACRQGQNDWKVRYLIERFDGTDFVE